MWRLNKNDMKYIAAATSAILSVLTGVIAATQSVDKAAAGWIIASFFFTLVTYFCAKDL